MDKLVLKVPGDTGRLEKIRGFVAEFAREAGCTPGIVGEIEFAVDEAATNIVKHAYGEDPEIPEERRIIEIEIGKVPEGIRITLCDRAKPFNPENVPLPDLDSHLAGHKTHGLGVFAMKSFMDSMEHSYIPGVGNRIVLTKRVDWVSVDGKE